MFYISANANGYRTVAARASSWVLFLSALCVAAAHRIPLADSANIALDVDAASHEDAQTCGLSLLQRSQALVSVAKPATNDFHKPVLQSSSSKFPVLLAMAQAPPELEQQQPSLGQLGRGQVSFLGSLWPFRSGPATTAAPSAVAATNATGATGAAVGEAAGEGEPAAAAAVSAEATTAAPVPPARATLAPPAAAAATASVVPAIPPAAASRSTTAKPHQTGAAAANASTPQNGNTSVDGTVSDKVGDLKALAYALSIDGSAIALLLLLFSMLRWRYPMMYSYNAITGRAPGNPGFSTLFGWWRQSFKPNLNEVTAIAGLDSAMLMEYCNFGMRLMAVLGMPMVVLFCPVYWIYGGGKAGFDTLSWVSMNNIQDHKNGWIYYLVAIAVWYVVVVTQTLVFRAQKNFITRRFSWLKAMPKPRATTVLVENIPQEFCSDNKLAAYFNNAFGHDVVEQAYVVRDTSQLLRYMSDLENAKQLRDQALSSHQSSGERPSHTDHSVDHLGEEIDTIDHYTELAANLEKQVIVERERIRLVTTTDHNDDIYSAVASQILAQSGFVTFRNRRDSEMALKLRLTPDEDEFNVSIPPDPSDVIYFDLQVDERMEAGRETVGFACVAGLFCLFLPLVVGSPGATVLRENTPYLESFFNHHPGALAAWDGCMGALTLTLVLSVIPWLLAIIFYRFFALKAESWLQVRIQQWYFYFLVLFVLLIGAVGKSFLAFARQILMNPFCIFELLASTMPGSSHFYLDYLPMQAVFAALAMIRYAPLSKFLVLRAALDEPRARELSEPEDQDYHGIGSRSAMITLVLVVALVYCTLCPIICPLAFGNFALCRSIYGYLLTFCETIKPDLGGVFWCTQMKHTQQGIFIYIVLMTGVLFERADTSWPGALAACSLLFMVPSYLRYDHKFHWESLPFEDILDDTSNEKRKARRSTYEQPELCDDFVEERRGNRMTENCPRGTDVRLPSGQMQEATPAPQQESPGINLPRPGDRYPSSEVRFESVEEPPGIYLPRPGDRYPSSEIRFKPVEGFRYSAAGATRSREEDIQTNDPRQRGVAGHRFGAGFRPGMPDADASVSEYDVSVEFSPPSESDVSVEFSPPNTAIEPPDIGIHRPHLELPGVNIHRPHFAAPHVPGFLQDGPLAAPDLSTPGILNPPDPGPPTDVVYRVSPAVKSNLQVQGPTRGFEENLLIPDGAPLPSVATGHGRLGRKPKFAGFAANIGPIEDHARGQDSPQTLERIGGEPRETECVVQ